LWIIEKQIGRQLGLSGGHWVVSDWVWPNEALQIGVTLLNIGPYSQPVMWKMEQSLAGNEAHRIISALGIEVKLLMYTAHRTRLTHSID